MTKLEQFYNAIPESVREQYKVVYDSDSGKMSLRHPFWIYIRESDLDFDNEGAIRVREHEVTIWMKNISIILHLDRGEAQVVHY